jgi:hypothetical protein
MMVRSHLSLILTFSLWYKLLNRESQMVKNWCNKSNMFSLKSRYGLYYNSKFFFIYLWYFGSKISSTFRKKVLDMMLKYWCIDLPPWWILLIFQLSLQPKILETHKYECFFLFEKFKFSSFWSDNLH